MLYDIHRSQPAYIPHPDLTPEDVAAFCDDTRIDFYAVGEPDDWGNPFVFRVSDRGFPARGLTLEFRTVAEWKSAVWEIGACIFEGGVYRRFDGTTHTTLFEAREESDGLSHVVHRNEHGRHHVTPTTTFFEVISHEGRLVPRYALICL